MNAEKLQALSRQLGVEPGFKDNWGVQRVASEAALTSILKALDPHAFKCNNEVHSSKQSSGSEGKASGDSPAAPTQPAEGVIVVQCGTTRTLDLSGLTSQLPLSSLRVPSLQLKWQLKTEFVPSTQDVQSTHGANLGFDAKQSAVGLDLALTSGGGADIEATESDATQLEIAVSEQMPVGYHTLILTFKLGEQLQPDQALQLIVVPREAWVPECSAPAIGISLQLYSLRSPTNWGIGDFADLRKICSLAASAGIDAVGVNPLHLLYTAHPERCSPYSPSSRCLLNPVYIDVTQVPGTEFSERYAALSTSDRFQQTLAGLRAAELIDHAAVSSLKLAALYEVFLDFYESETFDGSEECGHRSEAICDAQTDFNNFIANADSGSLLHARFTAFDQHFSQTEGVVQWSEWPPDYQRADSKASEQLAVELSVSIRFHLFLEWLATTQLDAVTKHCHALGMAHGLYLDLAVGVDRDGGDIWANRSLYAEGLHVGAPPDELGPLGQDWSLTPWNPSALQGVCYQPFVQLLRSSMRYAGILRLDHVMGLMRQYWCVPELTSEGNSTNGAYVEFPLSDLLGILALESHRNNCLVVGEDLGTVPDGFRQQLEAQSILGYRVLYFEREHDGTYKDPSSYTACSLATASTHDLPPLAGFLHGRDLKRRAELGLLPENQSLDQQLLKRQADLAQLNELLQQVETPVAQPPACSQDSSCVSSEFSLDLEDSEFIERVHALLARAASRLVMLQLEDLCGSDEMVNMPGTTDQHPNWQRRMTIDVNDLAELLGNSAALKEVVKYRRAA